MTSLAQKRFATLFCSLYLLGSNGFSQEAVVVQTQGIVVRTLGEINNKGKAIFPQGSHLMDAVKKAEPTMYADLNHVHLKHQLSERSETINVRKLQVAQQNGPALNEGDIVFIPNGADI